MSLDIKKSVDIIETMENYISSVRPNPEIRHMLDIGYEIDGQSVILNEIRPVWNNPQEIYIGGYAKTTYVHVTKMWKVFWKRADGKWHSYKPMPEVEYLKDFLKLVDEDGYGCFKG